MAQPHRDRCWRCGNTGIVNVRMECHTCRVRHDTPERRAAERRASARKYGRCSCNGWVDADAAEDGEAVCGCEGVCIVRDDRPLNTVLGPVPAPRHPMFDRDNIGTRGDIDCPCGRCRARVEANKKAVALAVTMEQWRAEGRPFVNVYLPSGAL